MTRTSTKLVLAFLAAAGILTAAEPAGAQNVRGRVVEATDGAPISGATVTLLNAAGERVTSARTQNNGRFDLRAPAAGPYRVRAEQAGFQPQETEMLQVGRGEALEIAIALRIEAVGLDPIIVTVRPREELGRDGFVRRRALGSGMFLDPAEVAALRPSFTTDVFRHVDGLNVHPPSHPDEQFVLRSLRGNRCMVVFVDNSVYPAMVTSPRSNILPIPGLRPPPPRVVEEDQRPRALPTNWISEIHEGLGLDLLDASRLRGIEVYREWREVPPEFRAGLRGIEAWPPNYRGGCGVVIVWTVSGW